MDKFIRCFMFVCSFFVIAGCGAAHGASLPDAPKGFTWYTAANGVGTFLRPDGWHVKEESQGNTHALFISRENIEESGRFKVGFSVNQVNHFSSGSSVLPFAYAKQFINKIVVGHEVLKSGVVKGGPTDMNIARIIGNNSGTKTIVHYITIGMDDKDVVYVISFEAKESEWDALYGVGGAMLNYIVLGS